MIGHEVLLLAGDSSSRILPILSQDEQYRIQFESGFSFDPDELASIIDRVINESSIADHYLVEVNHCGTGEVVYSYEKRHATDSSLVPCKGRVMPEDCYSILITLLSPNQPIGTTSAENGPVDPAASRTAPKTYFAIALLGLPLLLIGFIAMRRKRQIGRGSKANLLLIGAYRFDTRNMELHFEQQRTELTSKEAELLQCLYESANTTIERTDILKAVWGDEGDYVGRTLDVYISKLRKKLGADPEIKILNIRGVGYKLVVDV